MADDIDGGYYAIKGFLYQFDKALIEIMTNPHVPVGIEQRQDVEYQDFVIQVKHKETQDYQHHKIKKPVMQLLDMFEEDQTQKFCLYCYFRDREPSKWTPSLTELDTILGVKKGCYTLSIKENFVEKFYIHFSENFEKQFSSVIDLIKNSFFLDNIETAYFYHSLLRSKLLDISVKEKSKREISRSDLSEFVSGAERTVFYTAYAKYLEQSRYEQLVKKEFFTVRSPNIENFERLFVIHYDNKITVVDLVRITLSLTQKYFKVNKSPQPYLCFIDIDSDTLICLKQLLVDRKIFFNDGTCFHGDKFRLEHITESKIKDDNLVAKIVNSEYLDQVINKVKFQEIYQLYLLTPIEIELECKHIKVQLTETKQVIKMLS